MKPRLSLSATLALFLLICGTVLYLRRPPEFKRYVSPPLADGTRYTFLYPRRMTNFGLPYDIGRQKPPIPMVVGGISIDDDTVIAPSQFQTWVNRLLRRPPPPLPSVKSVYQLSYAGVRVMNVFDASATPRIEWESGSLGSVPPDAIVERNVTINDRRTRQKFVLACDAPGAGGHAGRRETKIIAESFRVLRPGEAVP